MFHSIDISTSGLVAQRQRMNSISLNIANAQSTRQPDGSPGPFQRRLVTFQKAGESDSTGGVGVKYKVEIDSTTKPRVLNIPGHPDADENGDVHYPGIKLSTEFVNAIDASRAYQANLSAMQMTISMLRESLQILQ